MKIYILILSMLMYSGLAKSQVVSDTTLMQGVYVMELHVRPIEDYYIFGFIPWPEGESVFPLAVAIALFIVLIFGLIAIIYEKLTIKKQR